MIYWKRIMQVYHRIAALLVATVLRPGAAFIPSNFDLWQRRGYHILPLHFYSPIPDTRNLEAEGVWTRERETPGIDWNVACQIEHLNNYLAPFGEEFSARLHNGSLSQLGFHLPNDAFVGMDPAMLYAMIRYYQPKQVMEIGSGHSTRVAMAAMLENGSGDLVSVDPYPNPQLRKDLSSLGYHVIEKRAERVSPDSYDRLRANDVLFIDSSHTVRIGGDVTYLVLEVLPRLQPGVIVHFHDIFLPDEYPKEYVLDKHFFWAEQYLLHGFLLFNLEYEILCASHYLALKHRDLTERCFPGATWYGGGSLWIRRKTTAAKTFR